MNLNQPHPSCNAFSVALVEEPRSLSVDAAGWKVALLQNGERAQHLISETFEVIHLQGKAWHPKDYSKIAGLFYEKGKESRVCLALFGLRLKQSAQTVESFELAVFRKGEEGEERAGTQHPTPSFVCGFNLLLGARVFIEGMELTGKLDDLHPQGIAPPFKKQDILAISLEINHQINLKRSETMRITHELDHTFYISTTPLPEEQAKAFFRQAKEEIEFTVTLGDYVTLPFSEQQGLGGANKAALIENIVKAATTEQWTTYDEWVVKYMKETGEQLPIEEIVTKMKPRVPLPSAPRPLNEGYDTYFRQIVRDNGMFSSNHAFYMWQILINRTPEELNRMLNDNQFFCAYIQPCFTIQPGRRYGKNNQFKTPDIKTEFDKIPELRNGIQRLIQHKQEISNYEQKCSHLEKMIRIRFDELQKDVHLTQSYPLYIYHSDEVYKHPVETIFHVDFYGKKASFEARLEKPERIHVKIKDNHPYGIGMGIPFTVVLELKPMKTEL